MSALTPATLKVETEDDLQVLLAVFTSVTDGDTFAFSNYFKTVYSFSIAASTSAATPGGAISAGTLTFKIASGTPTIYVRLAGN